MSRSGSVGTPMVEFESVNLPELLNGLEDYDLSGHPFVDIVSLSYDSRTVEAGTLFFCIPGLIFDGHEFAGDAVARGAVALCVQRPLALPVPQIVVPDVRSAMARMARTFYGDPSRRLRLVGITGTNGKTTTAYLVAWLLEDAGIRTGLLTTVERVIGGEHHPANRTTPEAPDLQRDLAAMVAAGNGAAVMEVSSHALELGRADGLRFGAVAFTNLTQDHLEFHGSFAAYRAAKLRLFTDPVFAGEAIPAVVNVDDVMGREIAALVDPGRLLTFAVRGAGGVQRTEDTRPDIELCDLRLDAQGVRGTLRLQGRALPLVATASVKPEAVVGADLGSSLQFPLAVPLLGEFNASNTLTALGLGLGLGLDIHRMLSAIRRFPGVPGRMQKVDAGQPFTVLVDYAHTPDSVENVLRTARAVGSGRIIALLGCGGDRDRTKRPKMGRALEEGSDVCIITSDNPRSEDPAAIVAEILAGLACPEDAEVQVDRREAIARAVEMAEPGDLVLILGKGHESGQEFADKKVPFDDCQVALAALHHHGWGKK